MHYSVWFWNSSNHIYVLYSTQLILNYMLLLALLSAKHVDS